MKYIPGNRHDFLCGGRGDVQKYPVVLAEGWEILTSNC